MKMQDKKIKNLLVAAILVGLSVFFYKDILFAKDRLISFMPIGDIFNLTFPGEYLAFGCGQGHRISLWNPYIFLGRSMIGNPGNPLFYPLNLIFFFLPLHLAINYSFLLNTVFSGGVVYFYLRYLNNNRFSSLLGAVVFMFNGVLLLHIYPGHPQVLQTLPWLALLFLFSEMYFQKNTFVAVVFGGVVLCIQFLAGYAQHTLYTLIAVSAYFLFSSLSNYSQNKDAKRLIFSLLSLISVILIGFGLAAFTFIPSLEFTRFSNRAVPNLAFTGSYSFPPQNLITYLMPEFYGDMLHIPYWGKGGLLWEMCGYVGILPLILSIIAVVYQRNKYTSFFAGLSVFGLLGALSRHTPLFKLFYYFLPGFNKFRGHSKMIMLFAFSVSILSAYGMSYLLENQIKGRRDFKKLIWPLGIFSGLVMLFAIFTNLNNGLALQYWTQIFRNSQWTGDFIKDSLTNALFSLDKFTFFLTGSFLLLFLWINKRMRRPYFKFFAFLLIIADLWLFGGKYIVSDDVKYCYWDKRIVNFLKEKGPSYSFRVMSSYQDGTFPNKALLDGIHMIDVYEALFLKRYLDLFYLCSAEPIDSHHNLKLLSMSNLKFLVMSKTEKLQNPDLIPAYQTEDVIIWQNLKAMPRAYIVHGARVIEDEKERISYILFNEQFDPSRTVILERSVSPNADSPNLPQQEGESVKFLKYSDDEIIIQAVLKSDGYLVLSDSNYPGWKADILDLNTGKRTQLEPMYANYLFRAVPLKKGSYLVNFVFRPKSFYVGSIISALTVIAVIISLIFIYRREKAGTKRR
jgi:hypothetical protein